MEIFLIGLGVTIAYYIMYAIIIPTGGLSALIVNGIKYTGIAMIAIGAVQWIASCIASDDSDSSDSSVSNSISQPAANDYHEDDEIQFEPSPSYEEDDISTSDINTSPTSNYPAPITSPSDEVGSTHRYPCRTCKNTGNCSVCDGSRQTKTRLGYDNQLGVLENEYEPCQTCGGSGLCFSCKGDGWIDEGVDF